MKKILLPTDFSDNSWNAIKYALQLFKDEKCAFYILNTYTPIIYNMEYMMSSTNIYDLDEIVKNQSENGLKDIKQRILNEFKNHKHSFKTISSFNNLIPEIREVVDDKEIDLIVMGTKGASGSKEVLFGSNTVHALKNAHCPLLAIPDDFQFDSLENILFPTDYKIDYKSIQVIPITFLAHIHKSKVHILNVTYGYDLSEEQEKNKKKLESYIEKVEFEFHNVSNKNLQEAINDFQTENFVDMLIMINNKHSFFENIFFKSVVKQIGFHLDIPFLVIPTKK
ncbi:universal stress protein [Urechidicola croceus]|uniref:Universal stress protein n=1 Tax=Urechidicola croceus TaxID=1850246 RepID=A0A1D8P7X6_9FLAO|nr:universal stress protein [Urechidicola croceus]AOW20670.1 universal stress protein [Urechidicola croceus]